MRSLRAILALVALTLGLTVGVASASPASASPQTQKPPCSSPDVDCDGESSDDAEPGNRCTFDHDGDESTPDLIGEIDEEGRCVCAEPPPTTTSTTAPPSTTSTTVAPTTTSTVLTTSTTMPPLPATTSTTAGDANLYQDCDDVRAAGRAPLASGDVGYRPGLDADGDGVACNEPSFVAAPQTPTSSGQLPKTGSTTGPMVATGVGLIAAGGAILAVVRRRLRAA